MGFKLGNKSLLFKKIIAFFKNKAFIASVIAIINFAFFVFIITATVLPKQYTIKAGDILQNPIAASRDIEDTIATEKLREEARASVSDIYRFDEHTIADIDKEVDEVFTAIYKFREDVNKEYQEYIEEQRALEEANKIIFENENNINDENPEEGIDDGAEEESYLIDDEDSEVEDNETDSLEDLYDRDLKNGELSILILSLKDDIPLKFSKEELHTCILADLDEMKQLEEQLSKSLAGLMELHLKQDNLLEAKNVLRDEIMSLPLSNEVRLLGVTIGVSVIKPNMFLDEEATEEEKDRIAQSVEAIIYKKGQHIVQAGQPVTKDQLNMLDELGLLKSQKINMPIIFSIIILVLIIESAFIFCLFIFERKLLSKPINLIMLTLISWMVLSLSLGTSQFNGYLIPVALGAMLSTILISSATGIIFNVTISAMLALIFDNNFNIMLVSLLSGIIGVYVSRKTKHRNGLIWAGLAVSLVSFATIFSLELLSSQDWLLSIKSAIWGIASGVLSGIFLVGTLPIFESVFNIVTPIKLIELANPNHPILKRLLMEAPGTYHHSILVANLAENAADAVNSDGLLARVGAYYHDIGKLKRPFYFGENQIAMSNPHDRLAPSLSTKIILNHTKDGVELAKKYKVPKVLQDFITQHHGTTAVAYFYHKAKESDLLEGLTMDDFRYDGPKPKTKETAIVMLADTVEAAVRSMNNPNPERVEALIKKLIKDKLDDGQLDNCDLTLKDLDKIANSFVGVMTGVFHERVEYPSLVKKPAE